VPDVTPKIYRAIRENAEEPFGCPELVIALDGFVEAATFSADEQVLYFHQLDPQGFRIYRAEQQSE